MMSALEITKLVFLGSCQIRGGSAGVAFAPLSAVDPDKPLDQIKRSPFKASRRSYVIGGIYEGKASVANGLIESLNFGSLSYIDRISHSGLADLEMTSAATDLMIKRERLEDKAKKSPAARTEIAALAELHRRTQPALRGMMEQVIIDMIRAEAGRQIREKLYGKGDQL
jgi:hypothetical protein